MRRVSVRPALPRVGVHRDPVVLPSAIVPGVAATARDPQGDRPSVTGRRVHSAHSGLVPRGNARAVKGGHLLHAREGVLHSVASLLKARHDHSVPGPREIDPALGPHAEIGHFQARTGKADPHAPLHHGHRAPDPRDPDRRVATPVRHSVARLPRVAHVHSGHGEITNGPAADPHAEIGPLSPGVTSPSSQAAIGRSSQAVTGRSHPEPIPEAARVVPSVHGHPAVQGQRAPRSGANRQRGDQQKEARVRFARVRQGTGLHSSVARAVRPRDAAVVDLQVDQAGPVAVQPVVRRKARAVQRDVPARPDATQVALGARAVPGSAGLQGPDPDLGVAGLDPGRGARQQAGRQDQGRVHARAACGRRPASHVLKARVSRRTIKNE